jgi:hypothetical protein
MRWNETRGPAEQAVSPMHISLLGFLEFFVSFLFVAGWVFLIW